ncbi:MAG: hypothetical protein HY737_07820 [Candidatus Omnitrophica bacterium]|nr:hypothetical protein [Candidatus Omnitrophota bacterium]
MYLEERLPIMAIAQRLDRSPASINTALGNFGIPRQRSIRKVLIPVDMTAALARIHAHVCGDGHLIDTREKDDYGYLKAYRTGYYRRRYAIGYTNKNPKLIEEFMRDCYETFGLRPRYVPQRWMVVVKSKAVWELIRSLGAGKSRQWTVNSVILKGAWEIQAAWLRAFFDDEAHFDPQGRIRARSVNRPGLEQVALMLRRFVPCHLTPKTGLYPDDSCYLVVLAAARPKFLEQIGSLKYHPPATSVNTKHAQL